MPRERVTVSVTWHLITVALLVVAVVITSAIYHGWGHDQGYNKGLDASTDRVARVLQEDEYINHEGDVVHVDAIKADRG